MCCRIYFVAEVKCQEQYGDNIIVLILNINGKERAKRFLDDRMKNNNLANYEIVDFKKVDKDSIEGYFDEDGNYHPPSLIPTTCCGPDGSMKYIFENN